MVPLVTVYLLSLAGAALTAWSWRRLSGSRPQATAVLALMVFNPIAFTLESQRVYRNLFIDAVATLAIGLAFVIAAEVGARRPAAEAAAAEAAPGTGTAHQRQPGRLRGRSLPVGGGHRAPGGDGGHHQAHLALAALRRGGPARLPAPPPAPAPPGHGGGRWRGWCWPVCWRS